MNVQKLFFLLAAAALQQINNYSLFVIKRDIIDRCGPTVCSKARPHCASAFRRTSSSSSSLQCLNVKTITLISSSDVIVHRSTKKVELKFRRRARLYGLDDERIAWTRVREYERSTNLVAVPVLDETKNKIFLATDKFMYFLIKIVAPASSSIVVPTSDVATCMSSMHHIQSSSLIVQTSIIMSSRRSVW